MMPRVLVLGAIAALLPAFTSCSGGGGSDFFALRILHASPDAPAVDVYLSGRTTPLVAGLAFGQSTGILEEIEGSYSIQLRAAGAAATSTPVFSTPASTFAGGARYTVIARGLFAGPPPSTFGILVERDALQAAGAGNFRARIFHASPDAGAVDIDVGDDGTVEIANLARFTATPAAGVSLPANTALQIGIRDNASMSRVTGFTLPSLPAGAEVIVVATGLVGKRPDDTDGFALRAAVNDGSFAAIRQDPLIYVAHASPDAGAVDIALGTSVVVAGATFSGLAGPLQITPGAYSFAVRPAGSGTTVATINTPPLQAGDTWLIIATGFLNPAVGEAAFQPVFLEEDLVADGANTRLQVLHVSPDAPAVDVSPITSGITLAQPPLVQNLSFPNATAPAAGLPVAPIAPLTLGVAATGSPNAIATFTTATVAGRRLLILAAGALSPRPSIDQSFRLIAIDTTSSPWTSAVVLPNP